MNMQKSLIFFAFAGVQVSCWAAAKDPYESLGNAIGIFLFGYIVLKIFNKKK